MIRTRSQAIDVDLAVVFSLLYIHFFYICAVVDLSCTSGQGVYDSVSRMVYYIGALYDVFANL